MTKNQRNIYIGNSDPSIALETYKSILKLLPSSEKVDIKEALDRISFCAVYSKKSSPYYHAAAMDGIALNHRITKGASEVNPIILKKNVDFDYINTGNPIKSHYDSVIMIEDVIEIDEEHVSIILPSKPFDHIRPVGEDIVANEMIIPSGKTINPFDMASMIQGGVEEIEVTKKPNISIIPTGKEIISNPQEIGKGKIMDSNSILFSALITKLGGNPLIKNIIRDDLQELKNTIIEASQSSDIVIVNAGSSAGTEDYTLKAIQSVGEVHCHGVALKPGKPTILGIVNQKPVIGIPGYPVSAFVAFDEFVRPLIESLLNIESQNVKYIEGILSKRITSSLKHKEIVRVQVGRVDDKTIVTPLQRGAGITMSLVKADGIIEVPRNVEGIEKGQVVKVRLMKDLGDIDRKTVSIGSHDLIMDILADMIPLSSNNSGSLGGILSLKTNECHIAPSHLLDEETGLYNISYLNKYLGEDWAVLKSIKRLQGLIVKKGNPKNITEIKDLTREDIKFVNRQRGAGTRVLLDYKLKDLNINKSSIYGYERELTTHMAVAAEVLEDGADVAMGVYSAAKAMDLDFIEIGYEEYDFVMKKYFIEDYRFSEILKAISSKDFKEKLEKLGGYKVDKPKIIRAGDYDD